MKLPRDFRNAAKNNPLNGSTVTKFRNFAASPEAVIATIENGYVANAPLSSDLFLIFSKHPYDDNAIITSIAIAEDNPIKDNGKMP